MDNNINQSNALTHWLACHEEEHTVKHTFCLCYAVWFSSQSAYPQLCMILAMILYTRVLQDITAQEKIGRKKGSDQSWTQDLRSNLSARLPFHTCIGTGVVGKGHRIETATLHSNATPAIVIGCDPQHVPVTGAAAWNCLRPVSQGSVAFPLSCDVMQHYSCKLISTQRFAH